MLAWLEAGEREESQRTVLERLGGEQEKASGEEDGGERTTLAV